MIGRQAQEREHDHNDNAEYINCSQISNRLHISKPAVSKLLNTLEEKGYVQRQVDQNDRRAVLVCLTPLGKQYLHQKGEMMKTLMERIIHRFGEQNAQQLICLLEELYAAAKDELEMLGCSREQSSPASIGT